jgi:CheY-like chemotaxis protein
MPGMSGLELAEALKKLSPSMIVVMLTSSREIAVAKKALGLGAVEYITKPFDPSYLRRELERLLGAAPLRETDAAYRPWRVE